MVIILLFGDQKISSIYNVFNGRKKKAQVSSYLSFQSIIVVFQMIPFLLQSFHFRFENLKFLLFTKIQLFVIQFIINIYIYYYYY